jgi:hypothetical protein
VAKRIPIITTVPDAVVEAAVRRHPTERDYSRVIGEWDADVCRPDGSLLLAYRVGRLRSADLRRALVPLVKVAKVTNKRRNAAGSNAQFHNGAAGSLHGESLAFARDHPQEWRALRPLLLAMDGEFRKEIPEGYALLERAAAETRPKLIITGTLFTTVTANRDHTGIHTDGNNLEGGYGVMTAIRSCDFRGGLFVLPKFRVAVDLRPRDVLIVDNREYHGNTLFESGWRVTAVVYFHASNLPLGHPLRV